MKRWGSHLLALILLGLSSPSALADVVNPPVDGKCPAGTTASSSHGMDPSWCHTKPCNADSDCTGGEVCSEQPLCGDGSNVVGSCAGTNKCPDYAPCKTQKVCVAPSVASQPVKKGCSSAPFGAGPGLGLLMGVLGLLVLTRSRLLSL